MAVLQKLLVDSWTSETEKAWTELWDLSATAMMKVCPLDTKARTVSGILHDQFCAINKINMPKCVQPVLDNSIYHCESLQAIDEGRDYGAATEQLWQK